MDPQNQLCKHCSNLFVIFFCQFIYFLPLKCPGLKDLNIYGDLKLGWMVTDPPQQTKIVLPWLLCQALSIAKKNTE